MGAQFGKVELKSAGPAYMHSFGTTPNESILHEGVNAMVDVRALEEECKSRGYLSPLHQKLREMAELGMQIQLKATLATSGGAGTAGYAMAPIYVDQRVVDTSRKYTPLVEMVPRVTNQGLTADYNKITAKGGGFFALEDAALAERDNTYARASTAIKYLYAVGRATGQARAAYPSYILEGFQATDSGLAGTGFSPAAAPNAKQLEVVVQSRAIREKEEYAIVKGDASTNAEEFSGIEILQSTTNKVDLNTTDLSYEDTETALQYAIDDSGRPNLAVCDTATLKDLRKIMINTFRYKPSDMTTRLPFGVSSHLTLETAIGPIPILFSQYMTTTSASKSIYFLDMNYIEMRVLQDLTYEELAKTNDSEKFMLKEYLCLLMKNTAFNSFIGEIK